MSTEVPHDEHPARSATLQVLYSSPFGETPSSKESRVFGGLGGLGVSTAPGDVFGQAFPIFKAAAPILNEWNLTHATLSH